jgi:uncharacterized protein YukE
MAGESWVGGDITGLHTMAGVMQGAPGEMHDVVTALSGQVDGLVGAAGWGGAAAQAFRKRWTSDSISAGSLADVVGGVASILGDLATSLDKLNGALQDAARAAAAQGVPIGPTGEPLPMATGVPTSPQAGAAVQAQQTYIADRESALQLAQGFRLDAAGKLSDVYDMISPEGAAPNKPDQWITIGDYVRGLYAIPDEKNRVDAERLPEKIEDAKGRMRQARNDLKDAKRAYAEKGLKLPSDSDVGTAHGKVAAELRDLRTDLQAAEAGEGNLPLARALNTKLSDLAKAIPAVGRATAALPDFLKFAQDIPVVDIAAAGLAAGFQTKEDIDKGWSPDHAAAVDFGSAAVSVLSGVGLVAAAVSAPVDIPVGIAAGAAGIVAIGIGDSVYQGFHEHWSEDIHDHGVVRGIVDGTGHMFTNVGKDYVNLAKDVSGAVTHGAKSLWHSVFG